MKKTNGMIFILLLLGTSFSYAAVVAQVGNYKIEKKYFDSKYKEVIEKSYAPPSKEVFLEDLIRYQVGLQEAKKRKVANDPKVREKIDQILYQGLIEKEIGKKVENIKVTEKEMKSFYAKNPEIRTSHILIQLPPNPNRGQIKEAKQRAQKILKEVLGSKRPFSELATLYTDDAQTKRNGGDIGFQTRISILPNYFNAANRLKVGEISKRLIETPFGFHIVKLTGRNKYANANKRHLRQVIFDIKRKSLFDSYFAKLKKRYKISINKNNLK